MRRRALFSLEFFRGIPRRCQNGVRTSLPRDARGRALRAAGAHMAPSPRLRQRAPFWASAAHISPRVACDFRRSHTRGVCRQAEVGRSNSSSRWLCLSPARRCWQASATGAGAFAPAEDTSAYCLASRGIAQASATSREGRAAVRRRGGTTGWRRPLSPSPWVRVAGRRGAAE